MLIDVIDIDISGHSYDIAVKNRFYGQFDC